MKKKKLIIVVIICFLLIGAFSDSKSSDSREKPKQNQQEESKQDQEESVQNQQEESKQDQEESVQDQENLKQNQQEVSQSVEKKKATESGDYTIDGIDFYFSSEVRDDATGKWRRSEIADVNANVFDYCVDYYNEMFSSDDEIHAIVNFSSKTTSKIYVLGDGVLDVCVYEYVKGEEHSASTLFSGDLLKEDFISIETGKPAEF